MVADAPGKADEDKNDCARYGATYQGLASTDFCYDVSGYVRAEILTEDVSHSADLIDNNEVNARARIDTVLLRESAIGTLSAFVRLQGDYDPGIFSDVIAGPTGDDFAVGLDAFTVSLFTANGSFHAGELENAGAFFIEDGFTDRGTESLDTRSSLGFAYQTKIKEIDIRVSLNDPRETTDANPIGPNVGFGISREVGPVRFNFGLAAVNVDDFLGNFDLPALVRRTTPFRVAQDATYGFGVGADIVYDTERVKGVVGVTYSKQASNDVIFSFSDGFDAVTAYVGGRIVLSENLIANMDVSYVTASQKGLRNFNGLELAFNVEWRVFEDWKLLTEIGFDGVDEFGAGEGFFFVDRNEGRFDALLQIQRDF
ncbi:MAG: porin [Pseudomonadota bacterium]